MPKISQLSALTTPDSGDELAIVDVSTSTTKKITRTNLLKGAPLPADTVDTQSITNTSVTAPKIDFGGSGVGIWWEEIGRTTLGIAGSTITINPFTAKKYLRIVISYVSSGGAVGAQLRFNNDSGNNYARRNSTNGATDNTNTAANVLMNTSTAANGSPSFIFIDVLNISASEKLATISVNTVGTSGSGTAPTRDETYAKWVNTSAQITRVDVLASANNFASGSEVVILGHN